MKDELNDQAFRKSDRANTVCLWCFNILGLLLLAASVVLVMPPWFLSPQLATCLAVGATIGFIGPAVGISVVRSVRRDHKTLYDLLQAQRRREEK